jgi:hypothetical protein
LIRRTVTAHAAAIEGVFIDVELVQRPTHTQTVHSRRHTLPVQFEHCLPHDDAPVGVFGRFTQPQIDQRSARRQQANILADGVGADTQLGNDAGHLARSVIDEHGGGGHVGDRVELDVDLLQPVQSLSFATPASVRPRRR